MYLALAHLVLLYTRSLASGLDTYGKYLAFGVLVMDELAL